MNAVMYGGGNIGRGFIGMLFSQSGYRVHFVDVAQPVVEALNSRGCYPVRILSDSSHRDVTVENVCAVDGRDGNAVADVIAGCDIMATAVGVNVLKFIIPNIAEGIRRRMARDGGDLNIIICENLMDANKIIEKMIKELLTAEEQAWMDEHIGLVEASIGRMVPVQTEEMKDGDPMRVCVERYGFLPVDKDAFKGEIPAIRDMVPFSPFDFYLKRKLYIHNMGHATCAYLGDLMGLEYIYQSIDLPEIQLITKNAMLESAKALSKKYGVALTDILDHVDDLLHRFTNKALGDTCKRVGGDPTRKLSPADRLIGASKLAQEMGIIPAFMAIGAAAGVHRYIKESERAQTKENARQVLMQVSELAENEPLTELILTFYELILSGASFADLRRTAQKTAHKSGII